MQIKEYEAFTLKECLQQVRADLGPEAVILETRKIRKGGVLGLGARDAVCLVAAIGINVQDDVLAARRASTSPTNGKTAAAARKEAPVAARAAQTLSAETSQEIPAALSGKQRAAAAIAQNPPRSSRADSRSSGAYDTNNELHNDWDRADAVPAPAARAVPGAAANKVTAGQSAAVAAARNAYARATPAPTPRKEAAPQSTPYESARLTNRAHTSRADDDELTDMRYTRSDEETAPPRGDAARTNGARSGVASANAGTGRTDRPNGAARETNLILQNETEENAPAPQPKDDRRFALLEKAMHEIREGLSALKREQQDSHERTVSAVVSAVAPALSANSSAAHLANLVDNKLLDTNLSRFPELHARLTDSGVSPALAHELLDALPDFDAWSEEAQVPLAASALRDLIARRVTCSGPIQLTPGTLKAVALIGPTGVGKTTTIAKLAAHFALVEKKRVALLTMDTYRIAAVEQLKIYSQILDIPVGVAYSQAEVAPVIAQYADYDLLLIDTAGRSQKNIMQVGELKFLLETVGCETHLVLSAQTKERDMVEAAQRFAAARVDSIIFSKLDETDSYGTLLNVADRTGIPLSYLTMGQKVPEDLEPAEGGRLAGLLID